MAAAEKPPAPLTNVSGQFNPMPDFLCPPSPVPIHLLPLYEQMLLQEYYYKQSAKKYHLELQRLAGKKVVSKLNLYQYNFNSALFQDTAKQPKKGGGA